MSNIMFISAKRSWGGGSSDAYGFIHIESIFLRAPDSVFHYKHKSIIQK